MILHKKYVISVLLFLFFVNFVIGQNINVGDLDSRFLKGQLEVEQNKSFFNILYIKNKSNKTLNLNIQINAPKDWNVIGNSFEKVTVQPLSEISLPVRVSVAKNVKGGVGYAVIAIISDENGGVYNTAYSFVKIPVVSKIKVNVDNNYEYFNQKNLKSKFEIFLENKGNIDELIEINFLPEKSLIVEKGYDKLTVDDISIKSGETKTLHYNVKLDSEIDKKKYQLHRLKIKVKTNDSVIEKRVWFKYMDWKYVNSTPDTKTPLNFDISLFNVFSNSTPISYSRIYGDILFKNNKELYYSFQNYNRNNDDDLWTNSKIETKFKNSKTSIFLGDYSGAMEHSIYGRGIAITQNISRNIKIKGIATKKIVGDLEDYALSYQQKVSKFSYELGGVYSQNTVLDNTYNLVFGKFSTQIKKNNISFLYGNSQSKYGDYLNNNEYTGWGYKFIYSRDFKKVRIYLNSTYGSPFYFGYTQGRLSTVGNINIKLNKRKYINIKYGEQSYNPITYEDGVMLSNRYTKYKNLSTTFFYNTKQNILLYVSPFVKDATTNNLMLLDVNNPFTTITALIEIGAKSYNKYNDVSYSFGTKYGFTNVYEYANELGGVSYEGKLGEKSYSVAQIRGGYKKRNLGLNFIFYIGPNNISQQFAYFYSLFYSKSITITPFFEKDFFNDKVKLIIRGTYINNLASKTSRSNINSEIKWKIGKGWTIRFRNTTSFQSVKTDDRSSSYNTSYFEFGINKSFNIQQPRLKYYDYKAVFYKDLNGNRIHDPNEPGVSDVLAEIYRANPEKDLKDKNYNGEFLSNELFSNEKGEIEYVNIVEGDYKIKYTPRDVNTDNFETESSLKSFNAKKDTVMYIPFMERNKLFGKISLHRTKHSALGDIPIDNIKITVEGNARTYSTLTDKDGYFELYIPVSDYYKVMVNNIFHEHFKLRQDYYIVKFNGYKQFEVSFDFDEKQRKIAFDESDFLITDDDLAADNFAFDDIKVIKQTTIKGVVKDATSLLPLHATISIHNTKTNQLISETASSKRTGVYFTSFFTGEDYNIKVSSKGYWVYNENLKANQVTTFENITYDVLLKKIFLGEEIKTENLKFKTESIELSPIAKAELDNILELLYLNPTIHIEIIGHADNLEALTTDAMKLSKDRATSVATYLIKNGLREARVNIKGVGNTEPISDKDTNEGRAKNRSVQIKITAF